MKKILTVCFSMFLTVLSFSNDKLIRIAASVYPMEKIVRIAAKDLEKKGYKVEVRVLTDYKTANIGLNAGDLDANFHQHEPFMNFFNKKANAHLVKVRSIYDVYVGFYSKKHKSINQLPKGSTIAIPNDPTNQSRALLILQKAGLIRLNKHNGLVSVNDVTWTKNSYKFMQIPIPSLVQAYQEADLVFNWPSHMRKIGVSVKDALLKEKDGNNTYAIILASRSDNKNSKKIKDLEKAMTSKSVKDFLRKEYKEEGYPVF